MSFWYSVDTARHDLYGFSVPDAFRQAVTEIAPTTETPPQVPDESPAPTGTACSGAIEKAATEVTTDDDEQGEAATTAFRPRVAWQVALFDAWPTICKGYGRAPSPAEAVRWMKRNDDSGTILNQGTNVEMWWQPQ